MTSTGQDQNLYRWRRWAVMCCLMLGSATGRPARDGSDAVRVVRMPNDRSVDLMVENRNNFAVTLELTVSGDNIEVRRIKAQTETYQGESQTVAARVTPRTPNQPWKWRCHFQWIKGNVHACPDKDTLYFLPFETGKSFMVCQGYHGKLTHTGQEEYAVDFAMPEGTRVCAARAGVVVDLKESSVTGGASKAYKNYSNYVSIAQADGTIAEYHHLQTDGVLVEMGQHVEAGTCIGLSGNTGYSTLPHLHFGVYAAVDAQHLRSYPVIFKTRRGLVRDPVERRRYTAGDF